jgi:iron(III) transport system substrate-binding protein
MPMNRRAATRALVGLAAMRPIRAAEAGSVKVLSTTDRLAVQPFIADFERRHAGLRVDYVQLGSVELYQHFLSAGDRTADVLWSSAMDLQIKLVNDGHALRYESPHAPHLPRWAVWKHEAYGTTSEPVGLIYHRPLMSAAELPRTHEKLTELLRADPQRFHGRVASYDIERSGLGFLIAAHDAMVSPGFWELVRALGACQASLHGDTQSMLESVASGRALLAYNVLGTYAEAFSRRNPEIGIAYLDDYTLVASRVAFVARHAPNPQGAFLWLDHLLSPQGQQLLAEGGGLYGVRTDSTQTRSARALGQQLSAAARPISLGPGLLAHLDQSKRQAFLKRWNQAARPR